MKDDYTLELMLDNTDVSLSNKNVDTLLSLAEDWLLQPRVVFVPTSAKHKVKAADRKRKTPAVVFLFDGPWGETRKIALKKADVERLADACREAQLAGSAEVQFGLRVISSKLGDVSNLVPLPIL